MIGIILLALIALGISSSMLYINLTTIDNSARFSQNLEEKNRMDQWEEAIKSKVITFGERHEPIVMFGINDPSDLDGDGYADVPYQQLPNGFSLPKKNSWGIPYAFCPIGVPTGSIPDGFAGSSSTVWVGNSQSEYESSLMVDINGVSYVATTEDFDDGTLKSSGVIAVIISIQPWSVQSGTYPSCGDVYFDPAINDFKINGGFLSVIRRSDTGKSSDYFHISSIASGDVFNLNDVLNVWDATLPDILDLRSRVDGDNETYSAIYNLTRDASAKNYRENGVKTVSIGSETEKPVLITSDSSVVVSFSNLNLNLHNVVFSNNITLSLDGVNLQVGLSKLPRLNLNKTRLVVVDATQVTGRSGEASIRAIDSEISVSNKALYVSSNSASAIELIDSKLNVLNGSNLISESENNSKYHIDLGMSSIMNVDESSMSFSSTDTGITSDSALISVRAGSKVILNSSAINSSDDSYALVQTSGELIISNSSLDVNALTENGVILSGGGSVDLSGSTRIGSISSHPVYGVRDSGGRFLLGTGSQLYANICWTGNLFTGVDSPLSGSSTTSDENYIVFNQSSWVCN